METLNAVQRKSCDGITLLGKLCKILNVILTVHNQYVELTFHISLNVIFWASFLCHAIIMLLLGMELTFHISLNVIFWASFLCHVVIMLLLGMSMFDLTREHDTNPTRIFAG